MRMIKSFGQLSQINNKLRPAKRPTICNYFRYKFKMEFGEIKNLGIGSMLAGIARNASEYEADKGNCECKFEVDWQWHIGGSNDENDGRLHNKFGTIGQRKDPIVGRGTATGGQTPQEYATIVELAYNIWLKLKCSQIDCG
jgi:hypothetical protein